MYPFLLTVYYASHRYRLETRHRSREEAEAEWQYMVNTWEWPNDDGIYYDDMGHPVHIWIEYQPQKQIW